MAIPGWNEVKEKRWKYREKPARRGYHRDSSSWTVYYISNFPDACSVGEFWKIFGDYGVVTDVYIARRRNNMGDRFGFVKFARVNDKGLLESKLNNIKIGNLKLLANIEQFDRDKKPVNGARMEAYTEGKPRKQALAAQAYGIAIVEVLGVPPHLWDADLINKAGEKFGKVIIASKADGNNVNLFSEEVALLSNDCNWICEYVTVNKKFKLLVKEKNVSWVPQFVLSASQDPNIGLFPVESNSGDESNDIPVSMETEKSSEKPMGNSDGGIEGDRVPRVSGCVNPNGRYFGPSQSPSTSVEPNAMDSHPIRPAMEGGSHSKSKKRPRLNNYDSSPSYGGISRSSKAISKSKVHVISSIGDGKRKHVLEKNKALLDALRGEAEDGKIREEDSNLNHPTTNLVCDQMDGVGSSNPNQGENSCPPQVGKVDEVKDIQEDGEIREEDSNLNPPTAKLVCDQMGGVGSLNPNQGENSCPPQDGMVDEVKDI
ncbi:hypothetical protein CTI12_AA398440 [Artemisia annua]|uniref:RRM domain-containing protein n=1 Tax=Artemisia annua TaxID=35608 RepID=A0A2U1MBN6_ARTAN|nr:hypothetical protein CTI12_AA398440 [Artemisia annua]